MAPVRPASLAIFDLDGTLADSFPWFVRVLNVVADKFQFRHVAEHEIDALRRCGAGEILARLDVPMWKVPAIAHHMRQLKAQHMQEILLFPGVRELLLTLCKQGVTIALVSSDNEANVRRQLGPQTAALVRYFDCGASLFGKAAKFKRVMKHANIGPDETISIGDDIRDIEAARAAGIRCGAVTWGYADPDTLHALQPDFVFSTMADIIQAFQASERVPAHV